MSLRRPLAREALLSAAAAAGVAAALAWLGPPGTDFAAHAYQRSIFLQHGFTLWNNFWYAGRYSFVTYSALYYPLAALLGIRLLAVATVATASLAFAVIVWREWGPSARWSSRSFAVVWAGIVLSAAFPFALGMALALLALWALQAGARWRFVALAALALAASPLAFLLLAIVLTGVAAARREGLRRNRVPALCLLAPGAAELALWRMFPGGGHFPFSAPELAAGMAFCLLGLAFTWRIERGGRGRQPQARPRSGRGDVVRGDARVDCCTRAVSPRAPPRTSARRRPRRAADEARPPPARRAAPCSAQALTATRPRRSRTGGRPLTSRT